MRKSSLCLILSRVGIRRSTSMPCHLASVTERRTSNVPCGGSDFISETMGASRGNIVTQKTWVAIALQLCFLPGKLLAGWTGFYYKGSRCSLHGFQRFKRTLRVTGDANRRSLTILRKQIKSAKLPPPYPSPSRGRRGGE